QVVVFDQVIATLGAAGIRPSIIHAANSPGSLYFPKARYDMVRFGITTYGLPPDDGLKIPDGVRPALAWHARVT
ncbi:alanine racemase, partial [Vibrio parahaemolyticus]